MLSVVLRTVSLLQYKRCALYGLPRIIVTEQLQLSMFYLIMWQGAYKKPSHSFKVTISFSIACCKCI